MADATTKAANDKARALCAKVNAGTATTADLDTIRAEKKKVYDVSTFRNNREDIIKLSMNEKKELQIFLLFLKALAKAWTAAAAAEKDATLKAQETAAATYNTNAGKELAATATTKEDPCDYV